MGLWNFIKESGTSLFGSSAEAAEAPAADALTAGVQALGLDTSGVTVTVDGDKVKVSGTAVTPEMQEKVILALGNVAGVASVEADVPGPGPVFYTVVKSDTLSAIAKRTLGNANAYPAIFEANKPMLAHPDKIYPGQMLRIPQK
ncbi:MAG: peptidoglycan-binding protein LysM [Pseudomonadota bacterium]